MADKAGCPVVPVAIAHSADVLENHFPFIRRAAITIRFGEPIELKSLPREQKKVGWCLHTHDHSGNARRYLEGRLSFVSALQWMTFL